MPERKWTDRRGCVWPVLALIPIGMVLGTLVLGILLSVFNARQSEGWVAPLLSFAMAAVLPIVPLVALIPYIRLRIRRMARRLDPAFAFLRPTPEQASLATRGWHTSIGERSLDAWYSRGPSFQLFLDTRIGCRAVFYRTRPERSRFAGLLSRHPILIGDGPLAGCSFDTTDFPWCHRLLESRDAVEALGALLAEGEPAPRIKLRPGSIQYIRPGLAAADLHESNLKSWLGELQQLARAIDRTGPSDNVTRASLSERFRRKGRGRASRWTLLGVFGCLPIALVAATLVLTAVGYLVYSAAS